MIPGGTLEKTCVAGDRADQSLAANNRRALSTVLFLLHQGLKKNNNNLKNIVSRKFTLTWGKSGKLYHGDVFLILARKFQTDWLNFSLGEIKTEN